ncbi:hypothetical protein KX928_15575 [Roseobacter sp. YSTF-M11]|uniref:HMA domain-containing protein n=1 Tax=Roseobacter insulae TaxID=2859783 RepID=A0A9X1FX68_9RHOB|nr:hypothetical protein [Roseobacter insulae]MBW4709211.1 hypothetical protein [Roseobacter insulae]
MKKIALTCTLATALGWPLPGLACEICAREIVVDQNTLACLTDRLHDALKNQPGPRKIVELCAPADEVSKGVIPTLDSGAQARAKLKVTRAFVIETARVDCLIDLATDMRTKADGPFPIAVSFGDDVCPASP